MSTADSDNDREEKKDSNEPLTQREVFELYLNDRELRPLLFGALGGLAMIFLVMFLNGSDIGAVIVALLGMATIAFRWTIAPPFLLLVLFYFQLFPFGVPEAGYENPFEIRESHFRVVDVVLVLSILVYFRCLYRIFGVVQQSMPFENVIRRKGDQPVRRPTSHIEPTEIAWLIAVAGVLAILGQAVWWLVNALEFAPTDDDFPLRWADTSTRAILRRNRAPGEFTPGASRFFVILGAMFFGLLIVRLIFGYWRLRMMNAAEGAMITTDTSWAESHRERVRVEKWRIWGRQRAAELAKKAAREERERRKKAEEARERAAARARKRDEEEDDGPRRRRR
jgi:hypothetical protein